MENRRQTRIPRKDYNVEIPMSIPIGTKLIKPIHDISASGLSLLIPNNEESFYKDTILENIKVYNNDSETFINKAKVVYCISDYIKSDTSNYHKVGIEFLFDENESLLKTYTKKFSFEVLEKFQYPLNIPNLPQYKRVKQDRRKSSTNIVKENLQNNKRSKNSDRRKIKPDCEIKYNFWIQSIKSVFTCLRDGLIWFLPLPKWFVKILVGTGDFAFIAHPRDFTDIPRMFPFGKYLPENFVKFWFRFQWPFITSRIIRIDPRNNKKIKGWLLICPLWAEQMLRNNNLARKKVINTVKLAEKIGCSVAGLGAFTSIVTHDGRDLVGKTSIGVTTGNPFSAAVAVANLVHAMSLIGKSITTAKIAVIGSAGSVGSGCSRALAEHVEELHLIDINESTLTELYSELKKNIEEKNLKTVITMSKNLSKVCECDGVIVVTNAIKAIIDDKHLKKGAVVIDCAQPKNVSFNVPKNRKDVLVIESAIVSVPGLTCGSDLDVNQGEALGCMAESMLLGSLKSKKWALGKVTSEEMKDIYKVSIDLGLQLAYFRNSNGFITEKDLLSMMNGE
jgi:fatty aldehyde-generating acyl-ACP reductase